MLLEVEFEVRQFRPPAFRHVLYHQHVKRQRYMKVGRRMAHRSCTTPGYS